MPVYGQELEPIVLPDQNLGLWMGEAKGWKYFRIRRLLPLYPGELYNFGTLAAGSSTDWMDLSDLLEVDDEEVTQYRLLPVDDVKISLRMPATGSQMSHTKAEVYEISKISAQMNPELNLTEFTGYEDEYPRLMCTNPTESEQNLNRIRLEGFRFLTEELETEPSEVTKASLYAW